ncbi:hypothetical protein COCON_G00226660 [Conger conger]|uniref:Uncharacterized protein n=1 Tax=Conger conger TaxID=82655 RepID=A0A9Q1HNT5_CONCO|nr:hypothetical protein COCON_G00226660 [Conger conger]
MFLRLDDHSRTPSPDSGSRLFVPLLRPCASYGSQRRVVGRGTVDAEDPRVLPAEPGEMQDDRQLCTTNLSKTLPADISRRGSGKTKNYRTHHKDYNIHHPCSLP